MTDALPSLRVVDTHYGGDVSRIVLGGLAPIPGATVAQKRQWLAGEGDALRRLLLYPPHGDPQMCADVIVEPTLPGAQAGYIILEAMGYPHFSGSNSLCVATALLESGTIAMDPVPRGAETVVQHLLLEAPCGPVRLRTVHDGHRVQQVTVSCDPAYVAVEGVELGLADHGRVGADLIWSGCWYAVVEAGDVGIDMSRTERDRIAEVGFAICEAAADLPPPHSEHGDVGPLAFVCLAGPQETDGSYATATYVHPGVVCACPTGTGTAARLAQLHHRGEVSVGACVRTTSPTRSTMDARITAADGRGVCVDVTGRAHTLGFLDLVVDTDDPMVGPEVVPLLRAGLPG